MEFIRGVSYNLRGLKLSLRTPRLLKLGLIRFTVTIFFAVLFMGLVLYYHQEILGLVWEKPESKWILWLWYFSSWLISLLLIILSTIVSYLISQIVFNIIIMESMSQFTEQMMTGRLVSTQNIFTIGYFFHLIKQEIPRVILPLFFVLCLSILGWLTLLGPVVAILSSLVAVIFLAWDNTDLVPARRLEPFSNRFNFLIKTLPFHMGFGLLFLIPVLNILFLSFAPVGATLYFIDKNKG